MSLISYETIIVAKPSLTEENIDSLINKTESLISDSGAVIDGKTEKWGLRKLAYEIDKYKEGFYILINFSSDSKLPYELNRIFRISDDILRYIIVKKDTRIKKISSKKIKTKQTANDNLKDSEIKSESAKSETKQSESTDHVSWFFLTFIKY